MRVGRQGQNSPFRDFFYPDSYPFAVETFADRLAAAMKAKGMTIPQLAVASGMHVNSIQRYRDADANREPVLSDAVRIAKAVGVDPAALLLGEDARPDVLLKLHWTAGKVEVEQIDEPEPDVPPDVVATDLPPRPVVDLLGIAAGPSQVIDLDATAHADPDAKEFVATVAGDSMEPVYPWGSRVRMRRVGMGEAVPNGSDVLLELYEDGDELPTYTLKRWWVYKFEAGVLRYAQAINQHCSWAPKAGGMRELFPHNRPRPVAVVIGPVPKSPGGTGGKSAARRPG